MRLVFAALVFAFCAANPAFASDAELYELDFRILREDAVLIEGRLSPYNGGPGAVGSVPEKAADATEHPYITFGPAEFSEPLFDGVLSDTDWYRMPDRLAGETQEFEFFGVHFWVLCPGADRFEVLFLTAGSGSSGGASGSGKPGQHIAARFSAPMDNGCCDN